MIRCNHLDITYLCHMNPNLDPTTSQFTPEEQQVDRALRPKGLDDFSGQQKIVDNLEIFIKAQINCMIKNYHFQEKN